MTLLLLFVLVLLVVGGGGYWYYGRGTAAPGYAPGSLIGILIVVFVLWLLFSHVSL